jgi:hypothetical protein
VFFTNKHDERRYLMNERESKVNVGAEMIG